MSQSVDLAAGVYNLSFMAAQRDKYQSQYESLEILVDGRQVGTATPVRHHLWPVPDVEFHAWRRGCIPSSSSGLIRRAATTRPLLTKCS